MQDLLTRLAADPSRPFALIRREGQPFVQLLSGDVVDVDLLGDIPLAPGIDVLALVPFRQIRERGYDASDDGAPLRCLVVAERASIPVAEIDARLHGIIGEQALPPLDGAFDVDDDEYAAIVTRVIDDEIGRGEGANFVIRRDFEAVTEVPPHLAVLAWFRRLLAAESGAYWTFAVHTPGLSLAGASPEKHISVTTDAVSGERVAAMNPISGTYRHPAEGPDPAGFLRFLDDAKETEELFMVVDEEMKMMSQVCASGGRIFGPYLKQMAAVTHTEYLLEGRTELPAVDVLRHSMFAPTVTGSPMQNACTVIARHEPTGRGYYAGVLALFEARPGGHDLDAPILIRTAYIDGGGRVRIPVGATLVRHSDPQSEVAETWAKAHGILSATGAVARPAAPARPAPRLADVDGVAALLAARNERLAAFWLAQQHPVPDEALVGRTATIVDAEDDFSVMLGHMLRSAGMVVEVVSWRDALRSEAELLVAGPGPGDPLDASEARIARMHEVVRARRESGLPLLAVCLSHQILCAQLGLPIERLEQPRQGVALALPLGGRDAVVGYYNTFTATAQAPDAVPGTRLHLDPATGHVVSTSGPGFASVQGHLESVLSVDGRDLLLELVRGVLAGE